MTVKQSFKHLITTEELSARDISSLIELALEFEMVNERSLPKVPALRGKTVCTLFFEESTRTRISFELAAKRLSADVINFNASASSIKKGESFRDTIETLSALGTDAFVIRHWSPGICNLATEFTKAHIINAGDGGHSHPTQALGDALTLYLKYKDLKKDNFLSGKSVLILGDILHSRVARSVCDVFFKLGAGIYLCGPSTLLPRDLELFNVKDVFGELSEALRHCDIIYVLRVQKERLDGIEIPSIYEYKGLYSLCDKYLKVLEEKEAILHAGPVNRDLEISEQILGLSNTLVLNQVKCGLSMRMAVLFKLLGGTHED
jgi:aspartate carbamoyltransferase catalytic subunit